MGKTILEVIGLRTKYVTRSQEDVYAVDEVSFKIEEGKTLGIAGESGCGKSITALTIMGLIDPKAEITGKSTLALSLMGYYFSPLHYISGKIIVDGKDLTGMKPDEVRRLMLGTEIAYIPQAAMNALNPTQKIIKLIWDVVHTHDKTKTKTEVRKMAVERFESLGLPEEVLDKYSVELSGGMKQRTVIAVSTILNPKVLIADEPSSALDVSSQKLVIKMLHELMAKGYIKTMIFITHELPLLYNVTDDILVMYAGQIVEKAKAKDMVFDPIHPYAKGLMDSILVPESGTREKKLRAIPGTPPNLKNPPKGCAFAERCRYVLPQCHIVRPNMVETGNGRCYRCLLNENELKEVYENDK